MTDASVNLWGRRIGAVSWDEDRAVGVYQYEPAFLSAGIEVSPFVMPVREEPYAFPALGRETFLGLPGLLSDALPDRFGTRLIDVWLAEMQRTVQDFNPVDRLCYMGTRATGALEFEPAIRHRNRATPLEIARLVDLADRVLNERLQLKGTFDGHDDRKALEDILSVGTSAGGARAKAVLAWSPKTGEFRSGQADAPEGFEHWILKFDGISNNRDREVADPRGFGRIEYACYRMALEAGIEMSQCRLHHEGGRCHFMTRRFDRDEKGRKIHMQSLGALQHYDFNEPGAYAYEQAILTIRGLGLGMPAVEEQFRRALFNVVARNQDDHVKNISFLMNRRGEWRLSPAYDVVYSYNPSGAWTRSHQMSLGGKRNRFARDDVLRFARSCGLRNPVAIRILDEVVGSVSRWRTHGADAGVEQRDIARIERTHRTYLHRLSRRRAPP